MTRGTARGLARLCSGRCRRRLRAVFSLRVGLLFDVVGRFTRSHLHLLDPSGGRRVHSGRITRNSQRRRVWQSRVLRRDKCDAPPSSYSSTPPASEDEALRSALMRLGLPLHRPLVRAKKLARLADVGGATPAKPSPPARCGTVFPADREAVAEPTLGIVALGIIAPPHRGAALRAIVPFWGVVLVHIVLVGHVRLFPRAQRPHRAIVGCGLTINDHGGLQRQRSGPQLWRRRLRRC
mmetsp:Transcript_111742/g.315609  ORF Transcript_111742/g.315609 Transcript_111742/m.315609 type:complete len:237 (-) Transcript_111742:5-715(-)